MEWYREFPITHCGDVRDPVSLPEKGVNGDRTAGTERRSVDERIKDRGLPVGG